MNPTPNALAHKSFVAQATGHPRTPYLNIINKVNFMELTGGIAELYGALLGDGCLSRFYSAYDKRTRFCVQLTGHTHDREYYEEILKPVIRSTFGISGTIRPRAKTNAIIYDVYSRNAFEFFQNLGMPVGKKQDLKIPEEITTNKPLMQAVVCGIFNTDGSIYRRYSKKYAKHSRIYRHLVVQFKMNALTLIRQIKAFLSENSIVTNKIIRDRDAFVLRITDQSSINSFMSLIRTRHKYHMERYLKSEQTNENTLGS
jgi:DNA-binding transcriptional regulator WhiA